MDRRNFLGLLAISPFISSKLFAEDIDIFTTKEEWKNLLEVRKKLAFVKDYVGYGKFNIISFDEAITLLNKNPKINSFSKEELDFMDKLFYDDPSKYGFYGEKTTDKITQVILEKDVEKVPFTGHYLFKGKSLNDYNQIVKDVGKDIILTSGIRSVPKQMSLYIEKIYRLQGNISQASRIIAPPAYTHHAINDFDVGKKGFGNKNFSTLFTTTDEFKSLIKLNYVDIRYTVNNKDGVIYEPWHIKVS